MKTIIASITLATLSACAVTAPEPVVSQFNGNSVSIQLDISANYLQADEMKALAEKTNGEANRICTKGNKRRAEFVSKTTTMTSNYTGYQTYLYLCL